MDNDQLMCNKDDLDSQPILGICMNETCQADQNVSCMNCIQTIHQPKENNKLMLQTNVQRLIKSDWNTITVQQPMKIQARHIILTIALSPDGRYIASAGGADSQIKIWDPITGKQVGTSMYGHTDWINQINYSKCGNYIVSGSDDGTIRQWNVQKQFQIGQVIEGHDEEVTGVQYTMDRRYIVSCSWDNTIRLWDSQTGDEHIDKRIINTNGIWCFSLSPIQNNIVLGAGYGIITICHYEKHQQRCQSIQGHTNRINAIQYSINGQLIISGSNDNIIKLWNAMSLQQIRSFHGHSYPIYSVNFSPDMRYIISGAGDNTARLWNLIIGKLIGQALKDDGESQLRSTQFSLDGKYLIIAASKKEIQIMLAPIDL